MFSRKSSASVDKPRPLRSARRRGTTRTLTFEPVPGFRLHIRLCLPVLTISDELDEVLHRLVQRDSAEHDRLKVSVFEGPHQADRDHRLLGHVPLTAALLAPRRPLAGARFLGKLGAIYRLACL